jgi:hypothetical protein
VGFLFNFSGNGSFVLIKIVELTDSEADGKDKGDNKRNSHHLRCFWFKNERTNDASNEEFIGNFCRCSHLISSYLYA